jgi:hypothetical protein
MQLMGTTGVVLQATDFGVDDVHPSNVGARRGDVTSATTVGRYGAA